MAMGNLTEGKKDAASPPRQIHGETDETRVDRIGTIIKLYCAYQNHGKSLGRNSVSRI